MKEWTIVALSDTHASSISELPQELLEQARHADMVCHLGDYTSKAVVDGLRVYPSFTGVYGNMDPGVLRYELKETEVITVNGRKIGLIHGWGSPWFIQKRIRERFDEVDMILYGHTHIAKVETIDDVLFVNPGSAVGRFPATRKSFALLTIGNEINARIVTL